MNLRVRSSKINNINTTSINIKNKIKKKYSCKPEKKITKIFPKTPIVDKYIKKETITDKKIFPKMQIRKKNIKKELKENKIKEDSKKMVIELSKKRFKEYMETIDLSNKLNILGDIYQFLYSVRTNYDYDYAFDLIVRIEYELDEYTNFFGIKKMMNELEKKKEIKIEIKKEKKELKKELKESKILPKKEKNIVIMETESEFLERFENEKKITDLLEIEINEYYKELLENMK